MKKIKKLLLCLSVSVPAQATEIDTLVNASQSIRNSFSYGIQAIGGMLEYAPQGGIASTGITAQGQITQAQADAYNQALATVQNTTYTYDPGAQQYFDSQAELAMATVDQTVTDFVNAATVLVEVATINEMAQDAQASGDVRSSIAIQDYAEANDVVLDTTEINTYNESLQAVEVATQTAAAYYAVAGDSTLIESANTAAHDMRTTYAEVSESFFDATTGVMTVAWANQSGMVALDLNAYYKLETDILTTGSTSTFFTASPEGGCWFIEDQTQKELCINGG